MPESQACGRFARATQKWRDLVTKRSLHFVELHASGRWRRYYTEAQFFALLREAVELAQMWTELAPRPEDDKAQALPSIRHPAAPPRPAA
jgi:uncharacterized repeat protein (TIGR03809 family)